jgi:hypothetical protein
MISNESKVCRKTEQVMTSELGDELVMMHTENGVYISLNKVGRLIWELTEQPVPVDFIVDQLTIKFKVAKEDCQTDTLNFLQQMFDQDIMNIV